MQEKFIGRPYIENEITDVASSMQHWKSDATQKIEGELDKTKEDVLMIATVNTLIEEELKSLGIDTYHSIEPERVHFLDDAAFRILSPDFDGTAFIKTTSDLMCINKSAINSKPRLFAALLHECLHRASTQKFHIDADGGVHDARVGYRLNSTWKTDNQNKFRGFNEVMIDYTLYKILIKNKDRLYTEFGITESDIQGPIYTYMHFSPILVNIVNAIAQHKSISPAQVFENFERGQFQNHVLVLKDVEKVFGVGALDVLARLGLTDFDEEQQKEIDVLINEFFSLQSESERIKKRMQINAFVEDCKLQKENMKSRIQSSKKLILSSETYASTPFAQSADGHTYVFNIEKDGVQVVYFGSDHVHDPENRVFSEIKKQFDILHPDAIYVEGIEQLTTHPQQIKNALLKMSEENACREGENIFTAKLAADSGIPCYSPEPKFEDEIEYVENCNFTHRDIFYFYVYRMIHQYQRMFPERILEGCTKYIKDFIRVFYQTSGWEYAEIMAFEQSILEELDIDNVEKYASAIDPIPWEHRTQSVTNQISRASSLFRDEYIFEQIAKGLQQYKKVFVVYGSAHAVKQEPAFRAFLASK